MKNHNHFRDLTLVCVILFAWQAYAVEWADWDPADFDNGELDPETTATSPANRARTVIGIGEEIELSLSGSWFDYDLNVTDDEVVPDSKRVTWVLTGNGSLSNYVGSTTSLTASIKDSSYNITVEAIVTDSGTKYTDAQEWRFTIDFTVVTPSGITVQKLADFQDSLGDLGPPNNYIGAYSQFRVTVTPTTVSFYNVLFRENKPQQSFTWPNGSQSTLYAQQTPWSTLYNNTTYDNVSTGLYSKSRIYSQASSSYVDFTYTRSVPEEYYLGSSSWHSWYPGETHPKSFRASDFKARVGVVVDNDDYGIWMGPYEQ